MDYTIIGGGPCGLALATYLALLKMPCTIIDENASLGGCHRVNRVNSLFTEHGPRVYSSSYKNTIATLARMGIDFYDIFTPYHFTLSAIGGRTISNFSIRELTIFATQFIKRMIWPKWGIDQSLQDFVTYHQFSPEAVDYLDRLCRLTDGEDISRYSLYKFLSLLDQQALYTLYQPREPNDVGLFRRWEEWLLATGYVQIRKNTHLTTLLGTSNHITHITVENKNTNNTEHLAVNNLVLCIPPEHARQILENTPQYRNAFGDFSAFSTWTQRHNYNQYISMTFYWDATVNDRLPAVWGFPQTEWGLAFIKMSDYMSSLGYTVVSVCITRPKTPATAKTSLVYGRTANQCTRGELYDEVYRQLNGAYGGKLPQPIHILLNPRITYDYNVGEYRDRDTAFVDTPDTHQYLPAASASVNNLFTVGTQNGGSPYAFTTMESAVSNAMRFIYERFPGTDQTFPFHSPTQLLNIMRWVMIVGIVIIVYKRYILQSR